jgi:5-methylthioadenosine/S-adenosylhomocysteine deaminase
MPIGEALEIAFTGSSDVLGMSETLGRLEPGYLADIILLDMSGSHHQPLHSVTANLIYNARASDVQTVIVDGRLIMRDRELLTLDKQQIITNVRQSMDRLTQRVPSRRIQSYNP